MWKIIYGWKHCINYKKKELSSFLITILVSGFLLSARYMMQTTSVIMAISAFVLFTAGIGFMYFVFISAQKWLAYSMGYEARYEIWKFGPFIGFLISMYIILFIPSKDLFFLVFLYFGNVSLKDIPHLRLGQQRRSINMMDMLIVGLTGPIILLILILILIPLFAATAVVSLKFLIIFGALILFFTALPFPYMNGLNILIKSRMGWVTYFFFSLVFLIFVVVSVATWNVWVYLLAIVVAGLLAYWFKKFIVPKLHA